jgi:VanZ family protein
VAAKSLKTAARSLWLAAIVVVTIGSLIPATSFPMRALDQLNISDKLEHVVAYMVLGILPAVHERRRFVIAAGIGAVVFGIALEFGQLLSGWRDFEVGDMVADAVGVCIGLTAGTLIRLNRRVRALFSPEEMRPEQAAQASVVFLRSEREQHGRTARKAHQSHQMELERE